MHESRTRNQAEDKSSQIFNCSDRMATALGADRGDYVCVGLVDAGREVIVGPTQVGGPI